VPKVPTVPVRDASAGHFGEGSMRPKIEALLTFVKSRPSGRGVLTNAESMARALRGETGTWFEGSIASKRT